MWFKYSKQSMKKYANEYWFHDNEQDYADGDVIDANHEMIAEDAIINHFLSKSPNSHYLDYDGYLTDEYLNHIAPDNHEFLEFLEKKYNYSHEDAIDNAYGGNFLRWLVTGDDETDNENTRQLFSALGNPRAFVISKWGWIRVQGKNIETQSLNQENLDQIVTGLYGVYGEDAEHMKFNIEVKDVNKYFADVPFYEIDDGSIRKRLRRIEDPYQMRQVPQQSAVPGYRYIGGSNRVV